MGRRVKLYTDNGEQSAMARKYLKENNISFDEINTTNVENSITIAKHRLPLLEVRASHRISTISGFNEFRYASALDSGLSYDDFVKRTKHLNAKR